MKRDKLDRFRTSETAILTGAAGVPFWITLSPRERSDYPADQIKYFYLRNASQRKAFRDFIRNLTPAEMAEARERVAVIQARIRERNGAHANWCN